MHRAKRHQCLQCHFCLEPPSWGEKCIKINHTSTSAIFTCFSDLQIHPRFKFKVSLINFFTNMLTLQTIN